MIIHPRWQKIKVSVLTFLFISDYTGDDRDKRAQEVTFAGYKR